MKTRILLPLLALATLSPALAAPEAAPPAPALHLFSIDARVAVDANGAITEVGAPQSMGKAVADAVEAQVRKLRYQAPVVDGKSVPGETWVHMQACTAPAGENYRLALRFRGNGPSMANMAAVMYPTAAMKSRIDAKFDVSIKVLPDGTASLGRATVVSGAKRYRPEFEQALAKWAQAMRFHVETVDGKPVGTELVQKVEFAAGDPISGPPGMIRRRMEARHAEAVQANALANDTCALALKAGDADDGRQVALDSPIRVSEAN